MIDAIVVGAIIALLIAGFWWTHGAGGTPSEVDDPAREEQQRFTELGDPLPQVGDDATGESSGTDARRRPDAYSD